MSTNEFIICTNRREICTAKDNVLVGISPPMLPEV